MTTNVLKITQGFRNEARKLLEAVEAFKTIKLVVDEHNPLAEVHMLIDAAEQAALQVRDGKNITLEQAAFFLEREKSSGARNVADNLVETCQDGIQALEGEIVGKYREHVHNISIAAEGVAHMIERSMPRTWPILIQRQQEQKSNDTHRNPSR